MSDRCCLVQIPKARVHCHSPIPRSWNLTFRPTIQPAINRRLSISNYSMFTFTLRPITVLLSALVAPVPIPTCILSVIILFVVNHVRLRCHPKTRKEEHNGHHHGDEDHEDPEIHGQIKDGLN
jgi:hypothetical protein